MMATEPEVHWKKEATYMVLFAVLGTWAFSLGGIALVAGFVDAGVFAYSGYRMANAPDAPWNRNDNETDEEDES